MILGFVQWYSCECVIRPEQSMVFGGRFEATEIDG